MLLIVIINGTKTSLKNEDETKIFRQENMVLATPDRNIEQNTKIFYPEQI